MTNKLDIEMEQIKFEEWASENTELTLMKSWYGYITADAESAFMAWLARAELESKKEWVNHKDRAPQASDNDAMNMLWAYDEIEGCVYAASAFEVKRMVARKRGTDIWWCRTGLAKPQPPETKDD